MGIAERKLREKNRRRNAILKAAKRLIAKHGVEGMTMNHLARSTELNKATIYLYYKDKDDLVTQLVAKYGRDKSQAQRDVNTLLKGRQF